MHPSLPVSSPPPFPPKKHEYCFQYLLVLHASQEKLKTMLKQIFGGTRGELCTMGKCLELHNTRTPHTVRGNPISARASEQETAIVAI